LTLRSEMPADNGAHQTSGAGEIESVLTRWVTSGTSYSAGLPPLLHGLVTSDTSTSFELARHIVRRYWSRFPETTRQALEVLPSTTERDELFRLGEELAGSAESFRNVIRYHPDLERVLMVDVVRQWYLLEPARMVVWAAALPESPARLQILQAMGIEPGAPSGAPL
jgi:hypothetical protein